MNSIFKLSDDGTVLVSVIDKSAKSIMIPDSVTEIRDYAFSGCTSLQSVDIPDSVTEIGNSAFEGCTFLQSVDIPDSVKTIGPGAFSGCTSLQSVDIPDSVTEIGSCAFVGCTSLQSIDIPDSVTKIGFIAFVGCTSLQSVDIPDSVTRISESAFYGCISLISISVAKDNATYFSENDVLYRILLNKNYILLRYAPKKSDKSFRVSEKTMHLGSAAFDNATELEKIVLHNGIISLGNQGTFAFCINLKEIKIPSEITYIPDSAFYSCSSLKEVFLPDSENYYIGHFAFKGCVSLIAIHSTAKKPDSIEIAENAFIDFDIDNCTLYVPPGTRWAYRHHSGFGKFKNIEIERS